VVARRRLGPGSTLKKRVIASSWKHCSMHPQKTIVFSPANAIYYYYFIFIFLLLLILTNITNFNDWYFGVMICCFDCFVKCMEIVSYFVRLGIWQAQGGPRQPRCRTPGAVTITKHRPKLSRRVVCQKEDWSVAGVH
jgi:hypothetical protein